MAVVCPMRCNILCSTGASVWTYILVSTPLKSNTLVSTTDYIYGVFPLTPDKLVSSTALTYWCPPPWRPYTGVCSPDVQYSGVHHCSHIGVSPLRPIHCCLPILFHADVFPLSPIYWCQSLMSAPLTSNTQVSTTDNIYGVYPWHPISWYPCTTALTYWCTPSDVQYKGVYHFSYTHTHSILCPPPDSHYIGPMIRSLLAYRCSPPWRPIHWIQYTGVRSSDVQYTGVRPPDVQYTGVRSSDVQHTGVHCC